MRTWSTLAIALVISLGGAVGCGKSDCQAPFTEPLREENAACAVSSDCVFDSVDTSCLEYAPAAINATRASAYEAEVKSATESYCACHHNFKLTEEPGADEIACVGGACLAGENLPCGDAGSISGALNAPLSTCFAEVRYPDLSASPELISPSSTSPAWWTRLWRWSCTGRGRPHFTCSPTVASTASTFRAAASSRSPSTT